jgi:hypothetical protein
MPKRTWNEDSSKSRIATRLAEVNNVTIKDYVRDTDLTSLGTSVAYRVDGVHLYVDIINIKELLETTTADGERAHKRALRFLNNHYRAVRNILQSVDAIQVDFHNQRLHAVFAKPYNDEAARVHKAVATAQLIRMPSLKLERTRMILSRPPRPGWGLTPEKLQQLTTVAGVGVNLCSWAILRTRQQSGPVTTQMSRASLSPTTRALQWVG